MMRTAPIVLGVVRRDDTILLVSQGDPEAPYWSLPGGLVEPGEPLLSALVREVWEEAGIQVDQIGRLAFVSQIERPQERVFAYAFEITAWTQLAEWHDPDGDILGQEWVSLATALERLQRSTWPGMREPQLAYLTEHAAPGRVWNFIEKADPANQRCVGWAE